MSSRARTILIIAVVAVVVVVAGIVAIIVTSGGDDDSGGAVEYGTVTVTGEPLPQGEGTPDDPDAGKPVPTIAGADYNGKKVTIAPGKDGPLMIVVMAHWCPHCNREVPLLVQWQQSGKVPEGLDVVGISTAVNPDRDHYPPSTWLSETMKWTWPVIADDEAQDAALAVGTTGYPFLVFVDAKGNLIRRVSGELPIDVIQQFADEAAATATAS